MSYIDKDNTNGSMMLFYEKDNYNEHFKHLKSTQIVLLWIISLSLLVTVLGVFFYLRRHFKTLLRGFSKISRGVYGEKIKIDSNNELQTIAEYFNKMSDSIKEKDDINKSYMQELEQKLRDIELLKESEQKLYQKATRDHLTSLYNREKFETVFDFIVHTAERENKTLVFAVVDIDWFKKVNDTYGHNIGDVVLKKTASVLQENIRKNDLVARWGGEEFVIAMLVNNTNESQRVLENIRRKFAQYDFGLQEKITLSIGLTFYRKGEEYTETFERADEALYMAKENGRNRVESKF